VLGGDGDHLRWFPLTEVSKHERCKNAAQLCTERPLGVSRSLIAPGHIFEFVSNVTPYVNKMFLPCIHMYAESCLPQEDVTPPREIVTPPGVFACRFPFRECVRGSLADRAWRPPPKLSGIQPTVSCDNFPGRHRVHHPIGAHPIGVCVCVCVGMRAPGRGRCSGATSRRCSPRCSTPAGPHTTHVHLLVSKTLH